jgi:Xaa-Pro aminopeptidase
MRIKKTRKILESYNLDAFLVSNMKNIRYLSAFTGDTGKMLIVKDDAYIIVDGRFTEQAEKESSITVVDYSGSFVNTIKKLLEKHNVKKCGFESNAITFGEFEFMKKSMDNVELVPTENIIESIRIIKEKEEVLLIKEALNITLNTFDSIKNEIVPGVTEKEIANEIEYRMKKLGAEGVAFDTIVASGKRSSLPHGNPTDKKIEFGDTVVIDMGSVYKGYSSDITRTIFVGDITRKQEMIYNIVESAQKKVIDIISSGMKCSEAYEFVVKEFAKESLENYFIHSLGHGVGLEVHERPYLSSKSLDSFENGMVITIEPGIYLPDEFGVRIEDMLILK